MELLARVNDKLILWVEDEYYHIKYLVKPLQQAGYGILPARSLTEAKTLVAKGTHIDLILLDLLIPYSENSTISPDIHVGDLHSPENLVRNGLDLLSYLVDDFHVTCPLVVLSIVEDDDVMNRVRAFGVSAVMPKRGLFPKQIRDKITEILEVRNTDPAPE